MSTLLSPPPLPDASAVPLASTGTGEFALIARHFARPGHALHHTLLGIGDDCALLRPREGHDLALSTDMLVAGQHFFDDVAPERLGHKALAVNLSDLAASGARPLAFSLALALPAAEDDWLGRFARGLLTLADAHACDLLGGDTTRGPLTLSLTVLGEVPRGAALLRRGAQPGDRIYASHPAGGGLGDARLALHLLLAQRHQPLPAADADRMARLQAPQRQALLAATRDRLECPLPRVALGMALRGVASACLDLSDGLQGDIGHLLAASGTGATLQACRPDGGGLLAAACPAARAHDPDWALQLALAGGDDYELIFTAPPHRQADVAAAAAAAGVACTCIGTIDATPGLRWTDLHGRTHALAGHGFDHFALPSPRG